MYNDFEESFKKKICRLCLTSTDKDKKNIIFNNKTRLANVKTHKPHRNVDCHMEVEQCHGERCRIISQSFDDDNDEESKTKSSERETSLCSQSSQHNPPNINGSTSQSISEKNCKSNVCGSCCRGIDSKETTSLLMTPEGSKPSIKCKDDVSSYCATNHRKINESTCNNIGSGGNNESVSSRPKLKNGGDCLVCAEKEALGSELLLFFLNQMKNIILTKELKLDALKVICERLVKDKQNAELLMLMDLIIRFQVSKIKEIIFQDLLNKKIIPVNFTRVFLKQYEFLRSLSMAYSETLRDFESNFLFLHDLSFDLMNRAHFKIHFYDDCKEIQDLIDVGHFNIKEELIFDLKSSDREIERIRLIFSDMKSDFHETEKWKAVQKRMDDVVSNQREVGKSLLKYFHSYCCILNIRQSDSKKLCSDLCHSNADSYINSMKELARNNFEVMMKDFSIAKKPSSSSSRPQPIPPQPLSLSSSSASNHKFDILESVTNPLCHKHQSSSESMNFTNSSIFNQYYFWPDDLEHSKKSIVEGEVEELRRPRGSDVGGREMERKKELEGDGRKGRRRRRRRHRRRLSDIPLGLEGGVTTTRKEESQEGGDGMKINCHKIYQSLANIKPPSLSQSSSSSRSSSHSKGHNYCGSTSSFEEVALGFVRNSSHNDNQNVNECVVERKRTNRPNKNMNRNRDRNRNRNRGGSNIVKEDVLYQDDGRLEQRVSRACDSLSSNRHENSINEETKPPTPVSFTDYDGDDNDNDNDDDIDDEDDDDGENSRSGFESNSRRFVFRDHHSGIWNTENDVNHDDVEKFNELYEKYLSENEHLLLDNGLNGLSLSSKIGLGSCSGSGSKFMSVPDCLQSLQSVETLHSLLNSIMDKCKKGLDIYDNSHRYPGESHKQKDEDDTVSMEFKAITIPETSITVSISQISDNHRHRHHNDSASSLGSRSGSGVAVTVAVSSSSATISSSTVSSTKDQPSFDPTLTEEIMEHDVDDDQENFDELEDDFEMDFDELSRTLSPNSTIHDKLKEFEKYLARSLGNCSGSGSGTGSDKKSHPRLHALVKTCRIYCNKLYQKSTSHRHNRPQRRHHHDGMTNDDLLQSGGGDHSRSVSSLSSSSSSSSCFSSVEELIYRHQSIDRQNPISNDNDNSFRTKTKQTTIVIERCSSDDDDHHDRNRSLVLPGNRPGPGPESGRQKPIFNSYIDYELVNKSPTVVHDNGNNITSTNKKLVSKTVTTASGIVSKAPNVSTSPSSAGLSTSVPVPGRYRAGEQTSDKTPSISVTVSNSNNNNSSNNNNKLCNCCKCEMFGNNDSVAVQQQQETAFPQNQQSSQQPYQSYYVNHQTRNVTNVVEKLRLKLQKRRQCQKSINSTKTNNYNNNHKKNNIINGSITINDSHNHHGTLQDVDTLVKFINGDDCDNSSSAVAVTDVSMTTKTGNGIESQTSSQTGNGYRAGSGDDTVGGHLSASSTSFPSSISSSLLLATKKTKSKVNNNNGAVNTKSASDLSQTPRPKSMISSSSAGAVSMTTVNKSTCGFEDSIVANFNNKSFKATKKSKSATVPLLSMATITGCNEKKTGNRSKCNIGNCGQGSKNCDKDDDDCQEEEVEWNDAAMVDKAVMRKRRGRRRSVKMRTSTSKDTKKVSNLDSCYIIEPTGSNESAQLCKVSNGDVDDEGEDKEFYDPVVEDFKRFCEKILVVPKRRKKLPIDPILLISELEKCQREKNQTHLQN